MLYIWDLAREICSYALCKRHLRTKALISLHTLHLIHTVFVTHGYHQQYCLELVSGADKVLVGKMANDKAHMIFSGPQMRFWEGFPGVLFHQVHEYSTFEVLSPVECWCHAKQAILQTIDLDHFVPLSCNV